MRSILLIIGLIAFVLCIIWSFTQDGRFEPWVASISALLFLVGLFYPSSENGSYAQQLNIISGGNSSKSKGFIGRLKQINFFSFGNTQEVEGGLNDKSKSKKNIKS